MKQMNTLSAGKQRSQATTAFQVRSEFTKNSKRNRYLAALKALSKSRDLERGKRLHADAIESKHDSDTYIANSLVNMYAKCGSMKDAQKVFDAMDLRTVVSWNALLMGYAENGEEQLCLDLIRKMSCVPDALTFVAGIKACTKLAAKEQRREEGEVSLKIFALENGRELHSEAAKRGFERDVYVNSALVNFYAKCGWMVDAREVFDKAGGAENVVSWNSLMLGYVENGDGESALELFDRLQQLKSGRCSADSLSFVAALKACTFLGKLNRVEALERGRLIHKLAERRGFECDNFVANTLIDMYAKCRSMSDARRVFDGMRNRSVVSWNALLLGYVENGEEEVALELFGFMRDCRPNALTLVAALKACSSLGSREDGKGRILVLEKGKDLHSQAAKSGFELDNFVANTLIDMYSKCGSLGDAKRVFDRMRSRDVVSWNALLLGYAECGEESSALEIFDCMRGSCAPSALTFVGALKACANLAVKEEESGHGAVKVDALEKGKGIHTKAAKCGLDSDVFVENSLVSMYFKCGSLADARKVFDRRTRVRSVVSWNTLLLGLSDHGETYEVLELFAGMLQEGCASNALTLAAVLKACVSLAGTEEWKEIDGKLMKMDSYKKGRKIHSLASETGCVSDLIVANTLLDLYSKCGRLEESRKVFDKISSRSPASWTALMLGYVESGDGEAALELYDAMLLEGSTPDALTIVAALKACTSLAAKEVDETSTTIAKVSTLAKGKIIHSEAAKQGYDQTDMYVASALVSFYCNCGSLVEAQRVFDKVTVTRRDAVLWNALLLGYADHGDEDSAQSLFRRSQQQGIRATAQTFAAALKVCGSLEAARRIHAAICAIGLEDDGILATSLVDVYGKCGRLIDARLVFESLRTCSLDMIAWNALMAGYSRSGEAGSAFELFHTMLEEGLQADNVTFICLLNGFNHAGLVAQAKKCFETMSLKFGVIPGKDHYDCMVDILGRANELDAAAAMVDSMPYRPDALTWTSVLSSCHKWKNVEVGRIAFEQLVKLDERDAAAAAYVLMAGIYEGESGKK